jgi:hypothetical protein
MVFTSWSPMLEIVFTYSSVSSPLRKRQPLSNSVSGSSRYMKPTG